MGASARRCRPGGKRTQPTPAPLSSTRPQKCAGRNGCNPPMTAQIDAAHPRLITLDRLITWAIAVGFIGVQGAWTVFLGWSALQLLLR